MKYSAECLDKAILNVLPDSDKWPASIQRPTRLDMAAKELFMYPEKMKNNFDRGLSELVVRDAMIDLATVGWFVFGSRDCF